MSTTVTYKGETLTTVNNTTKTLETKGTWLEDDIELTDVSGGGSTLITKNISANGTYNASSDSADGYSQVNVAVPASAVDTGTKQITANGNNQDVVGYAAVNVAVPNSYSAGDEGKVVDSGALVAQTAHADVTPTTSDQTIDTTTNNSLKVKGDANLLAPNIKKDVIIFGTTGSYEGGGGGYSVADILQGAEPSGVVSFKATANIPAHGVAGRLQLEELTIDLSDDFVIAGYGIRDNPMLERLIILNSTDDYDSPTSKEHGSYAITGNGALKQIILRGISRRFNVSAFRGNSQLQIVDIESIVGSAAIRNTSFYGNNSFNTLIIRQSSVATIDGQTFQGTVFASGGTGGTLYVPQSMITSYQSASNWSTILGYANNSIQKIEGSPYESLDWYTSS